MLGVAHLLLATALSSTVWRSGTMRFVAESAWTPTDVAGLAGDCLPGRCDDGNPRDEHEVHGHVDARTTQLLESGVELLPADPALAPLLERIGREGLSGALSPEAVLSGDDVASLRSDDVVVSDVRFARAVRAGLRFRGAFTLPVRCTGLVERRGGPAGTPALEPRGGVPADAAHVDQHRDGEPLRSLAVGWLFRLLPWIRLLNVWTPLSTRVPVQPLAFVHVDTVLPSEDFVRHRTWRNAGPHLPTDVLFLRPSVRHRWVFATHMAHGERLVFDALATPHGALRLPHEASLARLRRALMRWAMGRADALDARECTEATMVGRSTHPHVADLADLVDVLCAARDGGNHSARRTWARVLLEATERHSVEMRCVAIVVPRGAAIVTVTIVLATLWWLCDHRRPSRRSDRHRHDRRTRDAVVAQEDVSSALHG